jgi:DNA modification methylase
MPRRLIETLSAASKASPSLVKASSMLVQQISVLRIKEAERNARTHSKKQIKQIQNSIVAFGWTSPILIDEHGTIIAGHGRFQAALELGFTEVPAFVLSGLSDAKKRALALADNKIASNAGWDRLLLAKELSELASVLPTFDLDIDITGFEPAEFDVLMGDHVDLEMDPGDVPAAIEKNAVTQTGDLWILGAHRLCCGDAGLASDVRNLMGVERAAVIFADPPFNVRIAGVVGRGKTKHREFAHASGEMTPTQFTAFLERWMRLAARYSEDGSIHYICMDWRHLGELSSAGRQVYSEMKNLVVWAKTNAGQGSLYRSQHELIFVFKNGEAPHQNNVELGKHGRNRSNVWTYAGVNTFRTNRMDDLSIHPTVKPIALVVDAMRDCSRRGDIVLDPFMGSGTTILAAERIGRRAFGLEIDPLYTDLAIRRWQALTGRDAVLENSNRTFGEVENARRAVNHDVPK